MNFNIISLQIIIFFIFIDIRKSLNQKSFNVKFHSIQTAHNSVTTIRTARSPNNISFTFSDPPLINSVDLDDIDQAVIQQSNKCTKVEILEKIQCFDDMPLDKYEVLQNSSAVIQCVVRNQHGKVQWRAQNVVLGYDRSVPGLERLRIIGDAGRGEHNLQITNIQKQDSGEYECQVQPVLRHPLLRRKTKLLVLVPPTTPFILYNEKKLIEHYIILNPLRNGEYLHSQFLTLQCQTSGAYPDLQFIWYWNRNVITQVMRPYVKISSISNMVSQIRIKTEQLKSNDKIRCMVENKASKILKRRRLLDISLSVTVDIKFYALPGNPEILRSSEIIQKTYDENESLDIVCRVHPRGSPSPEIKWFWKFNAISHSELFDTEQTNFNKDILEIKPNPITEDHFNDEISTQLNGFKLSRFHHAANICCAINHIIVKKEMTSCVMIKVRFPPTKLIIDLPVNRDTNSEISWKQFSNRFISMKSLKNTTLIDGRTYTFRCSTNIHFTKLKLVWSISFLTESREQINMEDGEQLERTLEYDFRQTFSYIKIKAKRSMVNKFLQCTAWPMNNVVMSTDIQLGVYYSPDKPHLSGYSSSQAISEHETMSLLCTSTNGHPLPDLHWYRDNVALSNREPVVSNGNMITSLLTFKVDREDNGKSINCVAKNLATADTGVYSNPIIIRTIFPARRVSIKSDLSQFKQILENSILTLTCETDSSNPASDVQWWRIRCLQKNDDRNAKRHVPCSKTKLKESYRENVLSDFNGWKSISKLNYKVEWLDHNNFIECESRLTESEKIVPTTIQYDRIRLNVIYQPHFPSLPIHGTIVVVEESQSLNFTIKVKANPEQVQFFWFKDTEEMTSNERVYINENNIYMPRINRDFRGNYSLIVSNELGKNEVKFYIDVTFSPSINESSFSDINVRNNDTTSISCSFEANPYSAEYIKWIIFHPLDILSKINETEDWVPYQTELCTEPKVEQFLNNSLAKKSTINCSTPQLFSIISSYNFVDASFFNNAMLQCIYDNKVAPSASRNFVFHMELPPQYLQINQYAIQGVANKKAVTLTCIFTGNPIIRVIWYNCTEDNYSSLSSISTNQSSFTWENSTIIPGSEAIYIIRPNLYRSEISFLYHSRMNLKKVCCQTQNTYGSSFGTIILQQKSKPNKPENVDKNKIGANYITIKWIQSFDGGSAQTFKDVESRFNMPKEVKLFKKVNMKSWAQNFGICYITIYLDSSLTLATIFELERSINDLKILFILIC